MFATLPSGFIVRSTVLAMIIVFIFVIAKGLFLFLLASLVLTLCRQPVFREKKLHFGPNPPF